MTHLTYLSPKESDPRFQSWDIEDSIIMSWLWNIMQPKFSKNYMLLSTTKEIWDMVKRTYSKVQDVSIIFEIKMKLSSTKQGVLIVKEYYNEMNGYQLELDHYQNIKIECGKDAATFNSILEKR